MSEYAHPTSPNEIYWKQYVQDLEPCLLQSSYRNETSQQGWQSEEIAFGDQDQLGSFCKQHDLQLPSVFFTAWSITLRAYLGTEYVSFGYILPANSHPSKIYDESPDPVLLTHKMKCFDEDSIQGVLSITEHDLQESFKHKDYQCNDIEHAFGTLEDRLFNTVVCLDQICLHRRGETINSKGDSMYDIWLDIDGAKCTLWHTTSRLTVDHAYRIGATFRNVLTQLMSKTHRTIGEINILTERDRKQIDEWNQSIPTPLTSCIHEILEKQTLLTPDAPAICAWDGELSYAELDRMATCLAHFLVKTKQVEVESFIAIAFEKSTWAIVAMTAIFKAGGICVPLDPNHPPARLNEILQDLGQPLTLCSPSQARRVKESSENILQVDCLLFDQLREELDLPCSQVNPENAALLVYTSGSTGKPKGVVQEHWAMASSIRDHCAAMQVSGDVRLLQFSAYTFDTSVSDIFGAFMWGGVACIPSDDQRLNDLSGAINSLRANFACLTPSVADQLWPEDVPTLDVLTVGGEALTGSIVQRWCDRKLINVYGVTEALVWCMATGCVKKRDAPANIGRNVCGRSWIVDSRDHSKLAPIGAVGELLLEGPLARHYYRNPNKTNEAFIEAPAWLRESGRKHASRLYRTGDLVQYSTDSEGSVTFIGRRDQQVKINGQRVEPGEIEQKIKQILSKGAEAAVVIKPKDTTKQHRIIAFVKPQDSDVTVEFDVSMLRLRDSLQRSLPSYMIPSNFYPLQKMPLTSSGKLDRQSLLKMVSRLHSEKIPQATRRLPSTEIEIVLQQLWATLFDANPEEIDADANFLHLGDSIAAMNLVTSARKIGLLLTVAMIFQHPLLSDMAVAAVRTSEVCVEEYVQPFSLLPDTIRSPKILQEIALQCHSTLDHVEDVYPCTSLQGGLMALSLKHPGAYVAQNVLALPGSLSLATFKAAWEEALATNAILRTRIVQTPYGMFQVVLKDRINWLSSSNLPEYLEKDKQRSIGLGDSLNRFALIQDQASSTLVFTSHHAAYDGWSIHKLYLQVGRIYQGSRPGILPNYKSFIKYLANVDQQSSEAFWTSYLNEAEAPSFPIMPTSIQYPCAKSSTEHEIHFTLSKSEITASMIIRGAWALLVGRYCNATEVVIGTTLSGRNAPVARIEDMPGPTITTVPVRVKINSSQTVTNFLHHVQASATEMMPHEHYGLQNIRRLGISAEGACSFQNLLAIQPRTTDLVDQELFGLHAEPEDMEELDTYLLTLQAWLTESGAKLKAKYDDRALDALQVQRLLFQLEHIIIQLSSGIDKPRLLLHDVEAVSFADLRQIRGWNATQPDVIEDCVHNIVSKRVSENPESPAVCSWDGELSYSQLDNLSSRLSHRLVALGVGPEVIVPLCFEKSLWTVVCILAVLKAGGAFVLIDHTQPVSRLQTIVDQVHAQLILSSSENIVKMLSLRVKQVCVIDQFMVENLPTSVGPPSVIVSPNEALYVQFTSGTTGKPKGCVIQHGSYCSAAKEHSGAIKMDRDSRVYQFVSYNFDGSILDILTVLMVGGCVCIPSEFDRQNDLSGSIARLKANYADLVPSLARLIEPGSIPDIKVMILGGEPMTIDDVKTWESHLHLISVYGPSECSVMCCVNQNPGANGARNLGRSVASRLWIVDPNNYHQLAPIGGIGELLVEGPIVGRHYLNEPEKTSQAFVDRPIWFRNEVTKSSERKAYRSGDLVRYGKDGTIVYVGRKDTQVKIRGQRIELREIELHLKRLLPTSNFVAEIVHPVDNKDGQVLAAFVSSIESVSPLKCPLNPISDDQSQDDSGASRAIYHEISSELSSSDHRSSTPLSISTSNYSNSSRATRSKSISSTNSPSTNAGISSPTVSSSSAFPLLDSENGPVQMLVELASRLLETLPKYMVPSVYLPLREIPLTINHKADRKRLQAIASTMTMEQLSAYSSADNTKRQPSNDIESRMQLLWAMVLRKTEVKSIGADDSFFRLGGDSIDAIKLVALARSEGLSITVANVFEYPRLSDLALVATLMGAGQPASEIQPFTLLGTDKAVEVIRQKAAVQCQVDEAQIEDIYPCSPLQQGLFAISVKESGMEVAQDTFILPQKVDLPNFKAAWEAVVKLNPVLRTRMIQTKKELLQVVIVEPISWCYASDTQSYLKADRGVAMQLGSRLSRFAIVESSNQARFCLTMHHAMYDGWSMGQMLQQVEQVYEGMHVAKPLRFNNFIGYVLSQKNNDETREFWQSELKGSTPGVFPSLPSKTFLPRANSFMDHRIDFVRKPNSDITTSTIIKAAWAMIVAVYTSSTDVVFGTTVTGRSTPMDGIDTIVGPTFATIPMRISLDYSKTPLKFLLDLQSKAKATIKFEQMGLQNISRVSPEAEVACSFQNMLVVQPAEDHSRCSGILGLRELIEDMANFNPYGIMLECEVRGGSATVNASFDSALIDELQMRRILCQFAHVVRQLCQEENKTLRDIETFSPQDLSEVLLWNQDAPEAMDQCVHHVIEDQASKRPQAPAICAWDGEMTYGDLDQMSSRFGKYLQNSGFGPNVLVPLCFDKSRWTIVAILAVLKSRAGFVLLDPEHHPKERLMGIVKEVNAQTIICGPSHVGIFASEVEKVVILSEKEAKRLPPINEVSRIIGSPDDTLCVMFTSGSTGKPKGIVHGQRGLCTSFQAFGPQLYLDTESRVLQFSAYAFDAAIGDILATLMHGGVVCIPSQHDRMNDITGAIQKMKANWALFTPSFARYLNPLEVPELQTLCLGGETILQTDVDRWADRDHVLSGYGPAECSLIMAAEFTPGKHRPPNLGWPLAARTWVTDLSDDSRLAPIGVIGHLIVEGPVIAAGGYLNDPKKTEVSFIEYPGWLPDDTSFGFQRMFRTGDLVRYNSDGTFDFIGRRDALVKLRGQRIELAEVEFRLREALTAQNLHMKAAVAIIDPQGITTNSILAAFLEQPSYRQDEFAESGLGSLLRDLTVVMSRCLPSYMLPSALVPISIMPSTASHKLDRKELMRLGSLLTKEQITSYTRAKGSRKIPVTRMEKLIANLWSTILGIESDTISTDDNFLRLGGDSIQAMRLVALAREQSISLTVSNIFKIATLSDLAESARISRTLAAKDPDPFVILGEVDQMRLRTVISKQCGIDIDDIEDVYPCTPLQEGLMSLSIIQPGSYVAYNVFELPPSVDLKIFQQAWARVIALYGILRTRIVQHEEKMLQVVVRANTSIGIGSSVSRQLGIEKKTPMLFGDQLNRFFLAKDEGKTHFIWSSHHSTYDGWSTALVLRAVGKAYRGEFLGQPVGFNRFIEYLRHGNEESEAFWREKLRNKKSVTFPPFPTPGYQPRAMCFEQLDIRVTRVVGSNITTPTIIRGAWAILLRYYCPELQYIATGTVLSGRNAPIVGIESLVGPTLTTVPVITEVDYQQSTAAFLEQLQRHWVEMSGYENYGLQNIARLGEDAKIACAFQNLLVIQPKEELDVGKDSALGDWTDGDDSSNFHTYYGLTLECKLHDDGFNAHAGFDSHLIEPRQMQRILYQFNHILQQLCTEIPNQKIRDLEAVSPEDQAELAIWNPPSSGPILACIHELIKNQADRQQDKLAITSWDGIITYTELDDLSSKLACHLIDLGMRPETYVPLCFEKSKWAVVSMLATLKTGAAFVPLDPYHPTGRLETIILDVGAKLVLCSPQQVARLTNTMTAVLVISEKGMMSLSPAEHELESVSSPKNTAFCLFTSGTTGKPKGVVVEHGAFVTAAEAHKNTLLIKADSRVLQFASYTFDASVLETLTTVISGGTICILAEEERHDPAKLTTAMTRMEVNWALLTPALLDLLSPDMVPGLQTLIVGGEPLKQRHIDTWADHVKYIQAYGPAECIVVATANANIEVGTVPTNIGRSVGSAYKCWITDVDDHSRLAPVGAIGELIIEGDILARGYLNNPEEEQSVFIGGPKQRQYKTGDLARYAVDGSIIYVRRKDNQVKLRGQRFELEEVEHHMNSLDAVRKCLAIIPKSGPWEHQLVAAVAVRHIQTDSASKDRSSLHAVTPQPESKIGKELVNKISTHLTEILPTYMIPTKWLLLEDIPLSTSGKLNRSIVTEYLASIDHATQRAMQQMLEGDAAAHEWSDHEKQLRNIWSQVLNVPEYDIDINNTFQRLGGDSISAMQIMAKCRVENVPITQKDILKCKTISELAKCIHAPEAASAVSTAEAMPVEELHRSFELSPVQQMFFEMMPDGNNEFDEIFMVTCKEDIPVHRLQQAFETIVDRHSMLRARFSQSKNGQWEQRITEEISSSIHLDVHEPAGGDETARKINQTRHRLSPIKGPVIAITYFHSAEKPQQSLFLTAHHLVMDLVSWRIILNDLEQLLRSHTLPPLTSLSFQSWSRLQSHYARTQLSPEKVLAFTLPAPNYSYWAMTNQPNVVSDAVAQTFTLSPSISASLLGPSNTPHQTEPLELFLSCLSHSFRTCFPDRGHPLLFNVGHGREPFADKIDISNTVGWFTAMYPINTSIKEGTSLAETIQQTRRSRRATPGNGWGYWASRYHNPLGIQQFKKDTPAEIVFNYTGMYQQLEKAGGMFEYVDHGLRHQPERLRLGLFEVVCDVNRGELCFVVTWNRRMSGQEKISRWVEGFRGALEEVGGIETNVEGTGD